MLRKNLHEDNRIAWNAATQAHNSHKADQAKFFREGGSTLYPEEKELLGDLTGKKLVHLQCNAGQDTLSLARLGANVTGVDISDTAIEFARQLSTDSGIPGTFHRADIFDWMAQTAETDQRFDIVFSSYGAINWLSDINGWAKGIAGILKPGGRQVLVDFHPFVMTMEHDWKFTYSYFDSINGITFEVGVGDYVAMSGPVLTPSGYLEGTKDFQNPHKSHEFVWGIGEILTALIQAGLTITVFKEYPFMNGARIFDGMREMQGGRIFPPENLPALPLMYAVASQKP